MEGFRIEVSRKTILFVLVLIGFLRYWLWEGFGKGLRPNAARTPACHPSLLTPEVGYFIYGVDAVNGCGAKIYQEPTSSPTATTCVGLQPSAVSSSNPDGADKGSGTLCRVHILKVLAIAHNAIGYIYIV